MALPNDYSGQRCSMARALEVVGERWTLLIVRDAFFGVRRFSDFAAHLHIPRAVLTHRLAALVEHGVLVGEPGAHGHTEYALTDKGRSLWPVLRGLLAWGDEHYAPDGRMREYRHATDDGDVRTDGQCESCHGDVPVDQLVVVPGPAMRLRPSADDPVSRALETPHRLLEPIRV